MNAKHLATFTTDPAFLLGKDEPAYSQLLDVDEILNRTHPVVCSIAFVKMVQEFAGKLVAAETECNSIRFQLLAVLDLAGYACR